MTRQPQYLREQLNLDLKAEAALMSGQPIPMKRRRELAQKHCVTVSVINKQITTLQLTQQHQWTIPELKDIWCNYESVGAQVLADKYGVTRRAVIQQIHNMRHCTHNVELPWLRG